LTYFIINVNFKILINSQKSEVYQMAEEIVWEKSLSKALESAGKENKLVLGDFFSPT
jgi:hypothetical protein